MNGFGENDAAERRAGRERGQARGELAGIHRVQAIDMVERFHEISNVLAPLWRQHTMALVSSIKNSPEAIAVAAKAHESLMASLTALKRSA